MSNENTIAPDASASWYSEREARIQAERIRVDAQTQLVENAHNALSERWNQLEREQEDAHDNMGITPEASSRTLINIERERQRLLGEADQLKNGYEALHAEKAQLERAGKLDYATLVDNSSEKSKLFLQVFRSKIEHDPAALRRLLHADSVARASNIPVDSNDYFASIEQHMGFKPEERRFEFESERSDEKQPKPTERKGDSQLTPEQKAFVKNLNGITEAEYAAAVKNPFSQANAAVDVDPGDFNTGARKSMEVSLDDEAPARKPAPQNYKPSNQSVNLSRAELDLIDNMTAGQGDKARDEMRKTFAANKIALRDGKAGHYQLYEEKLRSQGLA